MQQYDYQENEDVVLVPDGNGNMVDPSFITRKYLGVTYHKRNKKWIAQASENGRSKYLGCFKTPEKAAQMYDSYVVSKGGENVKTNFPVGEIDHSLKPLVKRYKKRSRDVMSFQQIHQMQSTDPWDSYLAGLGEQYAAKRRKRSRDPTAPKGPRNAYMMYIQKNREKLQKECISDPLEEGNSFGAISRELGRRWKNLEPSQRKEFEELAAEDKMRHEREKRDYECKLKDVMENQKQQESYLKAWQESYQQYAKMQQQWLTMMGYSTPATPADSNSSESSEASASAPSPIAMYDYSAMGLNPTNPMGLSPTDPSQIATPNPILNPPETQTAMNDPQSQLNQQQALYNQLQNFYSMDDCTELYDQLDYTPEELACLQNAWIAAAQQAQMTALQQMDASQMAAVQALESGNKSATTESEQKDFDQKTESYFD